MNWLLDTDTVVYYMRAMPAVVKRLEATRASSRYISLITLGEIYFGIYRSAQAERNLRRYRRFFARVKLLPFTPTIAERFGTVKADLARRVEIIADHDVWIAAHALVHKRSSLTMSVISHAFQNCGSKTGRDKCATRRSNADSRAAIIVSQDFCVGLALVCHYCGADLA